MFISSESHPPCPQTNNNPTLGLLFLFPYCMVSKENQPSTHMERQTSTTPTLEVEPLTSSSTPVCDMSILDEDNQNPRELVKLFTELHENNSHKLSYTKNWAIHIDLITYCAQKIINRGDELSRPAYELFKGSGVKVTWPNIFLRMYYAYVRKKRAEAYALNTTLKLKKQLYHVALVDLEEKKLKHEATIAENTANAKADELALFAEKQKAEKEKLFADNTYEIINLKEKITERIQEKRKVDETNNLIGKYNTLLKTGEHNLSLTTWHALEYIPIPEDERV